MLQAAMTASTPALDDLVTANRILAREGVVDSFGQVGIRACVPTWDSRTRFGDTNLLVTNAEMAADLAAALGHRPAILMRGHGAVVAGASLRAVVFNSIYLQLNADLQMKAGALGDTTFLSDGEIAAVLRTRGSFTYERAWEFWCRRAGRRYDAGPMEGPQSGA